MLAQLKFDWTINLSSIIWGITSLTLATTAWVDLRSSVKRLEEWRKEHMADAKSRDKALANIEKILYHLSKVSDEK